MTNADKTPTETFDRGPTRDGFAGELCWETMRARSAWAEVAVLGQAARREPPFPECAAYASVRFGEDAELTAKLILMTALSARWPEVLELPPVTTLNEDSASMFGRGLAELKACGVIDYEYDDVSARFLVWILGRPPRTTEERHAPQARHVRH